MMDICIDMTWKEGSACRDDDDDVEDRKASLIVMSSIREGEMASQLLLLRFFLFAEDALAYCRAQNKPPETVSRWLERYRQHIF